MGLVRLPRVSLRAGRGVIYCKFGQSRMSFTETEFFAAVCGKFREATAVYTTVSYPLS